MKEESWSNSGTLTPAWVTNSSEAFQCKTILGYSLLLYNEIRETLLKTYVWEKHYYASPCQKPLVYQVLWFQAAPRTIWSAITVKRSVVELEVLKPNLRCLKSEFFVNLLKILVTREGILYGL